MKWLRQRHGGCWLALFAMVVQFSFAFGHIHGSQSGSQPGSQFHVDSLLLSAAKSLFTQAPPKFIPVHKSLDHQDCKHHRDNDQKNENSQVCLTLAAANSAVLPVIAGVVSHFKSFDSHRVVESTVFVSRQFLYSYQVRAPPFASIV